MKEKTKKIILRVVGVLLFGMVFGGMFAISVPVGIAALCFYGLGIFCGYMCRQARIQQKFFDALIEHKEDILVGKIVTVTADDDEISIVVTDPQPKKEKKEKKEK